MAGSPWSHEEEAYFWGHIVPFSRKRKGVQIANPESTWGELGARMQKAMGEKAKRTYTHQVMEEHFHLNVKLGRVSRHAGRFVRVYKALDEKYPHTPARVRLQAKKNAQQSTPAAAGQAANQADDEDDVTNTATKPGAEYDWELGGEENMLKRQFYEGVGEGRITVAKGEDIAKSCLEYCLSGGRSHTGPATVSGTAGGLSAVAAPATTSSAISTGTEASSVISGPATTSHATSPGISTAADAPVATVALMIPDIITLPSAAEDVPAAEDDVMDVAEEDAI